MSTSVTSMPKAMTSMTSMANRSNTRAYTMSSTEATKLGRGGGQEGRDANEDLEVILYLESATFSGSKIETQALTTFGGIYESPSFCELSPNSDKTSLLVPFYTACRLAEGSVQCPCSRTAVTKPDVQLTVSAVNPNS